jgi:tRNA dimethylallyltransferase
MENHLELIRIFLEESSTLGEKAVLVVCGPTASGKTALSLELAEAFNGEIISADSAQVYRGMDIGTAKVTAEEQARAPHHLIDVRNPDESFTMADFRREGTAAIEDILARGKLPILCGGTGLYLDSIVDNYQMPVAPPIPELRAKLEEEALQFGVEFVHEKLAALDPEKARLIHPNNLRYVVRAIEVFEHTKGLVVGGKGKPAYRVFKIGIDWPREVLYDRINRRVEVQIQEGLLTEIKGLLDRGFLPELQSMQALGYKELVPYVLGEKPLSECLDTLKQSTRNYAKRQLTWFRKDKDINWINHAS